MKHYVGLDISMKETFICVVDEKGKIINQGSEITDPKLIAEYLEKLKITAEKVGLESGSLSHWLLQELKKEKVPALCIDARKMAAILSIQINKTDKNDAKGIADAMRCNLYREVITKSQTSGETVRQGRVSKCGSSAVRTLLNEAALVLLTRSKSWSSLKAWGMKICKKHGFKKATMAVGRKLAVIMHRMLINKTPFIYENLQKKNIKKELRK